MNKIILQDCIEGISTLKDESVDVIIADPPYNIGKDFGNLSDKQKFENYLEWCDRWTSQSIRVLNKNGSMFIYGFSEILAHIFVRIPNRKKWLIWSYSNKTTPTAKTWIRSHESIIQVSKEAPIFNLDDIRIPYSRDFSSLNGKERKNVKGRFGNKKTNYSFNDLGAMPRDVINFPALAGGSGVQRIIFCKTCLSMVRPYDKKHHENHELVRHPTQKPYQLTETLIKSSINKEKKNLILIPFAGSGSECYVCKKMGQDFLGFEINPDYVQMIEALISESNNMMCSL